MRMPYQRTVRGPRLKAMGLGVTKNTWPFMLNWGFAPIIPGAAGAPPRKLPGNKPGYLCP
ncbi:hypothetical protein kuro4_04410 [Gelria sp. Kuro-4]|nr:hypothetical protein kuro4_04410 [Gelria sp. Kuro-4]